MKTDMSRVRALVCELLPEAVDRTVANPLLYGAGGALDSLGLVNLLADVEMQVSTAFGVEVVLASERAMSRKRSPFRDLDSLTEYVVELLQTDGISNENA